MTMLFDTTVDPEAENVRVVGPTDLSSVDCESFNAAGATMVNGDVDASDVSLKGTASIGGDVTADEFVARGATEVAGNVVADDARVKGSTSVGGDLRADRLEAKGSSEFADVTADSASIAGALSIADLAAETAEIKGVVDADRVRADEVRIALGGDESTVETVVGGTVVVVEREGSDGRLDADTVEGEVVEIEHATVEEVIGEEVRLGPGARVGVVRADDLDVDERASVESIEERS